MLVVDEFYDFWFFGLKCIKWVWVFKCYCRVWCILMGILVFNSLLVVYS